MMKWLKQLFHRSVTLEESPGGFTLWIEKGFNAYYLYIPSEDALSIARELNGKKEYGLQTQLGIKGIERMDYIIIPGWAFVEARRLITEKALEEVKP